MKRPDSAQHRKAPSEPQPPRLRRRLACLVYEVLVLFGVALLAGAIGAALMAITGAPQDRAMQAVGFVVFGAYFVWFWSRQGQTLPMQTWRIKLVTQAGHPPSVQQAALRYVLAYLWVAPAYAITLALGLSRWPAVAVFVAWAVLYALLALLHPRRQFWHDAFSGTELHDMQSRTQTLPSTP
jgi:uncharacterized RDD family membrane protein YckC